MSKEYDNTNSGSLFDNDRKEKETHPDYTGTLNVDGKEFWVSAWKKTSKTGKRFFSLSVKSKDAAKQTIRKTEVEGDEIPF